MKIKLKIKKFKNNNKKKIKKLEKIIYWTDSELEFFKYRNFDKTLDIIRFGLTDMASKIDGFKTYLLFKLIG